jgi:hypothetical protein
MVYSCPICGGKNVQLLFPVWVDANDLDDTTKWELDVDARPERDSDKCWCQDCDEHVLLVETLSEEEQARADRRLESLRKIQKGE